jgi:putative ABC transport system permease protein
MPQMVTSEYFRAMGIRLLQGRGFDTRDGVSGPAVFIINEALAKQYFPNETPLGHRLAISVGRDSGVNGEIVGVVRDVMQGTPGTPPPPQLYLPWSALNPNACYVMVRTAGDPTTTLNLLKSQVYAVDKNQAIGATKTLEGLMSDTLARSHLMLMLLGVFGVIALVIAAVGVYGVMAYSVGQRTMEFGIRMALGASRANVFRDVLGRGMTVVGLGLGIGLGVTLVLGRIVQSMLYNVSPRDPLTLAVIVVLLLLVSFFACLLPARRATKVNPIEALRAE